MSKIITISDLIHRQEWIGRALECIQDLNFRQTLHLFATLEEMELYIKEKKKQMAKEILEVLALRKKWKWDDTGEKVIIDKSFFGYYFDIPHKVVNTQFLLYNCREIVKGHPSKISTHFLLTVYRKIVEKPDFHYES